MFGQFATQEMGQAEDAEAIEDPHSRSVEAFEIVYEQCKRFTENFLGIGGFEFVAPPEPPGDDTYDSDTASQQSTDNDSILSDAGSISSTSSVADPLGAADEFVVLLLEDSSLQPLYEKIRQHIPPQQCKEELHILLTRYSRDIVKEAELPLERTAGRFIRRYRRKVAYKLHAAVYDAEPDGLLAASQEPDAQEKRRLLEQWLKFTLLAADEPLPGSSSKEVSEEAQESSSSDNEGADELTNLKRVQEFLVKSKAFDRFYKGIQRMIEQTNQPSNLDLDGPEPTGQSMEEDAAPPDDINKLTRFIEEIYRRLSRLLRPKTPHGFKRMEWRCASPSCPLIQEKLTNLSSRTVALGFMETLKTATLHNWKYLQNLYKTFNICLAT